LPVGGAPDLAVEILSPGNTFAEMHDKEMHDKLVEYFANGTGLAWLLHPQERYIWVYRSAVEPDRLLKSEDTLTGEEVVPGFVLALTELFQPLAFS